MPENYILEINDTDEDICYATLVFSDFNELEEVRTDIVNFTRNWNCETSINGFTEDLYSYMFEKEYYKKSCFIHSIWL